MPDTKRPPLPTYDDALARIMAFAPPLPDETVALDDALGRVLAAPISADRDQPPFDRSAMDGFALRAADLKARVKLPIAGAIAAGASRDITEAPLEPGTAKRIATGAPLPPGADTMLPIELATVDDSSDPPTVSFSVDTTSAWSNIHRRASDASAGQTVIEAGTVIGPHHIGIAATVGAASLTVKQRPRVVVLATGDEVMPFDTPTDALEPQQIRNSNGPMLCALLNALGCNVLATVHVPDDAEQTLAAAREALSHAQLVVTAGGVSVGQRDWLPKVWPQLGLETVVHGVAIQPGKPLLVAQADCKLVVGLPGNPVSVLATAHLFAMPIVRRMLGLALPAWRDVTIDSEVRGKATRQVFRAAKLAGNRAQIIHWHGSGDLMHTAAADAFVRLPLTDEPVPAGATLPALALIR